MKPIFILLMLLVVNTSYSQEIGDTIKIKKMAFLWNNPDGRNSERLKDNCHVILLKSFNNKKGMWYNVKVLEEENSTGYIHEDQIKYNLSKSASEMVNNDPRRFMKSDLASYGKPDKESKYASGDYKSITWTWYCTRYKYLQIDYVWDKDTWRRESIYESDCIE